MYIKKLKDLISITLDDYRNERYSAQHNQLILKKIWPTFLTLVKFYTIIGLIYVIIQNSLYFSSFNKAYTTFYFYIQLVATVIYVSVVERITNSLRESYKLQLIFFTFILIESSFQIYLVEVYLQNETENNILTVCQLFINLLLVLGIVRTIKLRIMILLKFYIYFIARGITFHFKTLQSVNILFFIILILYFWDQQLINLSKVSQFTDQTLKSIPSAVCVLDQNCQDVLFTNNFTNKLINSLNYGGFSGTKSINLQNQRFPSQESILSSPFNELVQFFDNLTLPQSEVKEQFNSDSVNRLDSKYECADQNQINLNQALKLIKMNEKQTSGCIYTLRCSFNNQIQGSEYPIIVEARIKTKLQYGLNRNAILLNLYDISPNFKSSYYKKLNEFKSQVIRSISHELRTRLNVIQGFLQVIQCNSINYDKETNKLLRAAFNNCRIQNLIISSIINYNLIREKKLVTKIEKCKLISKIQEVLDLFQEEAEIKNIRITFQKQINQQQNEMLDYEKFQSILIHMISNSIKFNNKGGQIFITITKETQDRDKIINNKENEKKTLQPSYSSQTNRSCQDLNESSFHFPLRKNTTLRQQLINPSSQFSNVQLPQQTNTYLYEYYIIEIKDNGQGINSQKLEAIQNLLKNEEKAFQDLDSDSASGMMLGLRASNALIKYLSGKEEDNYITIDSIIDQGTTVCIHLKCRVIQLTDGLLPSDLYNKESSQIELEGKIPDIECQSFKFNIWTDPEMSSKTNMICKTKRSSQNINLINKKGSVHMFSNNNISSFYKNMEGSQFKSQSCFCEQKIVIVDDEPYNLLVLESLLKQLGYLSIKADNGKQCVQLIENNISLFDEHKCQGFKAIIMDYQMPIMNGQEATKQLQFLFKEQSRIQIPIFGLTGFSGEDDLINLIDAGMREVYIKPITLKTLEEMINNLNLIECRDTPCLSSRQFQCFELNYADDLEQLAHE
ncbi:unnamed protein product [Paramecium sonneborni]|uniref:Uncharacterized protein n=1 Tax=Paramecium sonneborni TaxID=65129 RepID=A0A8S1LRJ6_9CILI|nr:unnamed protein product [Paramecium sonneborni]